MLLISLKICSADCNKCEGKCNADCITKIFVVQDVLHEIRDIDMNMGAGTPAKKPNFFWLGKVRLFPHLAIPVGNLQGHF
jgi:hypothetical protein